MVDSLEYIWQALTGKNYSIEEYFANHANDLVKRGIRTAEDLRYELMKATKSSESARRALDVQKWIDGGRIGAPPTPAQPPAPPRPSGPPRPQGPPRPPSGSQPSRWGTPRTGNWGGARPPGKPGRRGLVPVLLVVAAAVALVVIGLWIAIGARLFGPSPTASATPTACPVLAQERRACPWTPEGYAVEPCGPGFCWDGGPQGSLACKQEDDVANAHRSYTSDLICDDGYVARRDPCTNVILECVAQ